MLTFMKNIFLLNAVKKKNADNVYAKTIVNFEIETFYDKLNWLFKKDSFQ